MQIGLLADKTDLAQKGKKLLLKKYPLIDLEINPQATVTVIVILGGDGFMLHSIHELHHKNIPLYGMNCGTIGFLLNDFCEDNLLEKISKAKPTSITPLQVEIKDILGEETKAIAFNEVSLLRETRQSTNISIKIDGKIRINGLVGDGVLVATPAGSSAYNFSVKGPIIPFCSDLLALTPISPFRPRQWRGALLPGNSHIEFIVNAADKRPVSAVADSLEVRNVKTVKVVKAQNIRATLLFEHVKPLEDKLLNEQFT